MLATIASLYLIRLGISITDGKTGAKKKMTIFEDVSLLFQYVFGVLLSQSKLFTTYFNAITNKSKYFSSFAFFKVSWHTKKLVEIKSWPFAS